MPDTSCPAESSSPETVRLAKRVAALQNCSRREAELLIVSGQVRVDGVVVEEPQHRIGNAHVDIAGNAQAVAAESVTVLLHKPAGVNLADAGALAVLLTPDTRWPDDASGVQFLKIHLSKHELYLPLETDASGLVVVTQDWRVARKFSEGAAGIEHEYVLDIADASAATNARALVLLNTAQPGEPRIKASWQSEARLRLVQKGLRPGEAAERCRAAGLRPLGLRRIRLGGVAMGKLPVGHWRYLSLGERF
jgi:23S rRNA pseudouridine2604 synthase